MSKGPGSRNEFAKKAKKMEFPDQMDNVDYGKKVKVVARTIDHVDTKTGAFYGTRTIMTKEGTKLSFKEHLILEASEDDITLLPQSVISELKKLIRQGAADLQQAWKNALELVHTAYHVGHVRLPRPDQGGAWKQYCDLISFGVKQLSDHRGIDGKWRTRDTLYTEAEEVAALLEFQQNQGFELTKPVDTPIGKRRFFVEIPGEAAVEADAKTLDDVIDQIAARIRSGREATGTKVRIELRNKFGAKLGIYVNDVKRDEIIVKEIS
jgi:hypothetical protein